MPEVIDLSLDSSPLPIRTSWSSPASVQGKPPARIFVADDTDQDSFGFDLPAPKRVRFTPSPVPEEPWERDTEITEETAESGGNILAQITESLTETTTTTHSRNNKFAKAFDTLDDPIVFTSSPLDKNPPRKPRLFDALSSDDDDEYGLVQQDLRLADSFSLSSGNIPKLSDKTAALLAGLKRNPKPGTKSKTGDGICQISKKTKGTKIDGVFDVDEDDSSSNVSEVEAAKTTTKRLTAAEKEALKASRAVKQAEKDKAKAAKAEQRALKARQRKQEAEIAEVNKRKTNKKDSTPEMIVDLPKSIEDSTLGIQTCQFLENVGAQISYWSAPTQDIVIRWRRKVVSRFNEDHGYREPIAETIQDEKHILLVLPAKDFVSLASSEPLSADETLDSYVQRLKTRYPKNTLLVIVEGLQVWKNKNKTLENRAFRSGVLSQLPDQGTNLPSSQPASRKSKKPAKTHTHVPEEVIEEALLRCQIVHSLLIHHTSHPLETAEWITSFTQHISTIPYKLEMQRLDTAFCMETGQVATGKDKTDTYIKMLQEIVRVTPPVAMGIQHQFPTVGELVKGLREAGPLALEGVEKIASGNVSGGRIGPAVSKRVWKIFTGLDPESNDGVV